MGVCVWGGGGGGGDKAHVVVYVLARCVFVCGGRSWIFMFTLAHRNGGNCLPLSHEMLNHVCTHFIMMWKKTSLRIIVHLIWSWCFLFLMLRKGACLGRIWWNLENHGQISSNIDKKVDGNSVTDPLPAPADDDSSSENFNTPYELLPAKTRSRTEPFDVHGLLSGAMTAHSSRLCSSSTETQRRKQHSEYCSQCSQQKNRPCAVTESSEAHTHLRRCGLFFNAVLLHHDSINSVWHIVWTHGRNLRLTLVLGLSLLEM